MDEILARRVLKEAKEVLESQGIEFWLNFGGLLGAVRDGKFISYDNDIELNAWAHKVSEKQMKDTCRELCKRGFNAYYSTLTDYIIMEKDSIPIAFSMFTLEGDKALRPHEYIYGLGIRMFFARCFYYFSEAFTRTRVGKINKETISGLRHLITFCIIKITSLLPKNVRRKISVIFRIASIQCINNKDDYGKTCFSAKFFQELTELKFFDMTFKVPANTEEYLEFVYGKTWKIPLKDWNYYDAKNKSITGIEFIDEPWDYH